MTPMAIRRLALLANIARRSVLVFLVMAAACAPPAGAPVAPAPASTFPPPPVPTAGVPFALPAPLPTPGGPVTAYPSLNSVTDLAFAPDGALWASTYEGLVRWDLATDNFQLMSEADGLPSPGVLSLAFAPDGSLWAGTQSGVARYDGSSWRTYQLAGGQGDDLVYDVAVAPGGDVWAGTGRGASHFDGRAWRAFSPADGLAGAPVWQVAPAPDGTVWFSTHSGGVSRFDPASGSWTTFTAPDSWQLPNARKLAIGPDGLPWVHIGYDNVYRFDGRRWVLAYPTSGQWVCDMAFSGDGGPWIATCGGFHAHGGGLLHREGGQWSALTAKDGLVSDDLTALALRPDGVIAVGSQQGIGIHQAGRWRTLRTGPVLPTVTGAAVTPDGVAWFAFGDEHLQTAGGGLARFEGQRWQYVNSANGLPVSDNVRTLEVAPDGSLWAGGGCSLGRLREDKWEILATCDQVNGNVVNLSFAPDGTVWFATEFDVFRLDAEGLVRYAQQLPLALSAAADGTAWVSHNPIQGGWISTLAARSPDGQPPAGQPITDTLGIGVVTSLAGAADGTIWAGSGSGVARLAGPGAARLYTTVDGLPEGGVVDLALAPDRSLWAATPRAVARLDGDRWMSYDLGLSDAGIRAIAVGNERIWLATNRGVFSLLVAQR